MIDRWLALLDRKPDGQLTGAVRVLT